MVDQRVVAMAEKMEIKMVVMKVDKLVEMMVGR